MKIHKMHSCKQICLISGMVAEIIIYKQYLRVSFKISVVDGLNQLLRDFNDLLLSCWCLEKQEEQSSFIHNHYLKIANQPFVPNYLLLKSHIQLSILLLGAVFQEKHYFPRHSNFSTSWGLKMTYTQWLLNASDFIQLSNHKPTVKY